MRERLPVVAAGLACGVVAAALVGTHVFGDGETKPRIPLRSAAEALPPESPTPDESGDTCIYSGPASSPKKIGCPAYFGSDECNSYITSNNEDFMLLYEGNNYGAVAARARPDRWNIRNSSSGPLLGYVIRTSDSYWTLYNPKGRRIGHITGPDGPEAALVYLYFQDSVECVM